MWSSNGAPTTNKNKKTISFDILYFYFDKTYYLGPEPFIPKYFKMKAKSIALKSCQPLFKCNQLEWSLKTCF